MLSVAAVNLVLVQLRHPVLHQELRPLNPGADATNETGTLPRLPRLNVSFTATT